MRPILRHSLVVAALAGLAVVGISGALASRSSASASRPGAIAVKIAGGIRPGGGGPAPVTGEAKGLEIRLSDAAASTTGAEHVATAQATPLTDAEAEALLARLPAIDEKPEDRQDAAMPPRSLPPPRTGLTLLEPWPPKAPAGGPPQVVPGPLEIVTHAPEGDVPLAARVALTFSQPMIAVTSHAQAEATQPARMTPQPPGAWRWAGSQLLIFEGPDAARLPMATRYDVEVPAGTRSATGGTLDKPFRFAFTTPPPRVVSMTPQGGPQVLDPLIVLVFDQRIDAAAMLAHVRLEAGHQAVPTRLIVARDADGKDAQAIRAMAGSDAALDRVLAFRAQSELPYDRDCSVIVEKGAPSAEGPLTTPEEQSFGFRTHGPFVVTETRCGWSDEKICPPESPWLIRFSNPLAPAALEELVRVSPAVEDLSIQPSGDGMYLTGAFAAKTTYEVVVSSALTDAFGQKLGKDARVSFVTGPATARLQSFAGPFVVVDPGAKPTLRVLSAGLRTLKIALYSVDPVRDWPKYHQALQQRWQQQDRRFVSPGKSAWSGSVTVAGDVDKTTETLVDLAPGLTEGLGNVIVVVEPGESRNELRDQALITWAQSTRLGLSAFVDPERMLVWANDLKDGRPAAGVALELGPGAISSAKSGDDGLAWLDLAAAQPAQPVTKGAAPMPPGALAPGEEKILRGNRFVIARRGADVAFLPENTGGWWEGTSWSTRSPGSWAAWHVFDDRGLYRPSETARIKGIVRRIEGGKTGDVTLIDGTRGLDWTFVDPVGNEIAKGHAAVGALGGFDLTLSLPAGMNLGTAWLRMELTDGTGSSQHPVNVQEFRRPEYEVKVSAADGPFVVGSGTTVTASALYFAGGPLPDADVHWTVTSRRGDFRPPGWDEFTFGEFIPWWRPWGGGDDERRFEHDGRTNAAGDHALRLDFLSCLPPRASSVTCEAVVQDVNRQAWSASTSLLVHPSDAWVGMRALKPFVERGKSFDLDVVVADRDGKTLGGREVTLRAARQEGRWTNAGWTTEDKDVVERTLTSGDKPSRASLELSRSGSWRITATVRDDAGRPNETVLLAWVSGNEVFESRRVQQQEVELIPDKKEYNPGDTARILVRAPFAPAEALLTLRRAGIVEERRLRLAETSTVIEVPIVEAWLPGITAQVDLVGRQGDMKASAPAFGSGSVELAITRRVRELTIAVKADEPVLEPGGSTTLRLKVTDAQGAPAQGEVAVIVADEAVLALAGYKMADPLEIFYPQRGPDVQDHHLRSSIELSAASHGAVATSAEGGVMGGVMGGVVMEAKADRMAAMPAAAPMPMKMKAMDAAAEPPAAAPIALRKDMNALALFEPGVVLSKDGTASVALKLPDSLTRYRVMAVAVSGPKLFGRGESSVTARRGLMVRPSLPRFLNFGDRAELPVVLQNQTGEALDVMVALRASNATVTGPKGFRVRVPKDDRVEVRFPATTVQAGTARVQAVAVSGALSDAAELSLPVWTPATTEAFATYGTLDSGAILQPVTPPAGVLPQFGELSLTTSSTALSELGDAALALWSYRFECSEQVASRLIGVLAMRDAVAAFSTLPPKDQLDAAVTRDVETLIRRQSWNGDVGLWRRGDAENRAWPWVSVHASHALLLARAKGAKVPDDAIERATRLLREIRDRIPKDYPDSCRRAIEAQALWVRNAFHDADPRRAEALFEELPIDKHQLETLAFLLPVIDQGHGSRRLTPEIVQHLRNRAAEEAGSVSFTESYGDDDWLVMHSARRTDGIILDALLQVDPESDLLPKIVRSLLDHRVRGAWNNTQENAFILLALDRYFATKEAVAPNFTASAWLGKEPLASQEWRGRSVDRKLVEVPMRRLIEGGAKDVVLSKDRPGRLYWRLGLTYAPSDLKLDPSQHGFVVERAYEGVDDKTDVRRDDDGTWHVKAGALIRSRVTMVATARRTHVALTDPLPAGVEALNPALGMTPQVAQGSDDAMPKRGPWWWWGPWFEHQNLRDDRAEAFTSLLPGGAWEYAWIGRATTPGRFVVPPSKAEEMYHPETFGRSASDVVVVE